MNYATIIWPYLVISGLIWTYLAITGHKWTTPFRQVVSLRHDL